VSKEAATQINNPRLLQDIRNQPQSLLQVLAYHFSQGRTALQEAAQRVRKARRVVITGMGASLYATAPLQCRFAEIGIPCVTTESAELLHYQDQICASALTIVVSRSGESAEIIRLLPKLKKRCANIIAVTSDIGSTLAKNANLVLVVASMEDERMAIQSYTGTLLTLMLLASAVAGDLDSSRVLIENLIAKMSAVLEANLDDIKSWTNFLDPALPVYFIGRGPSCSSAFEGALLFNETAKHPAIGITAGNFRHGHVEVVDAAFRGIIFAGYGKTRELNLALAEALYRFRGEALVVGPADQKRERVRFIDVPAIPDRFAPLIEILPVQIAALRLAERKGLPVGTLRHIQQITHDEAIF
jgi:glucosamine--fructose-6-phosphate aminotransferase (isomerizing)